MRVWGFIAAAFLFVGCEEVALTSAPVSSNLPIVVIDHFDQMIPDEPKIPAQMKIYEGADRTEVIDAHLVFESSIGIELRGSTSLVFPKQQYGFELRNDQGKKMARSVLGMPADSKWILHAPYADKTLMRNSLSYNLYEAMGHYAPRTRFVELYLMRNGEPQYWGVHIMMEKIQRALHRVVVASGKSGVGATSGYLFKFDKIKAHDDDYFFDTELGKRVIIDYPKTKSLTEDQKSYLEEYIASLEEELIGDENLGAYLDLSSFADYYLLSELARNVDSFVFSTYLYKNPGGPVTMGPAWDFNLGYNNADYCDECADIQFWGEISTSRPWRNRLIHLKSFQKAVKERWQLHRQGPLSQTALAKRVDEAKALLSETQVRNFERWPILGQYVWPNPLPLPRDYDEEVRNLRSWILERAALMDRFILGG